MSRFNIRILINFADILSGRTSIFQLNNDLLKNEPLEDKTHRKDFGYLQTF